MLQSIQSEHFHSYPALIVTNLSSPSPVHFAALLPLANSWISIAVFVDVSITYVAKPPYHRGSILTSVSGCRFSTTSAKVKRDSRVSHVSPYRPPDCHLTTRESLGTDNVIERLIRTAIETASIGAIFCVRVIISSLVRSTGSPLSRIDHRCHRLHHTDRNQSSLFLRFTPRPYLHVSVWSHSLSSSSSLLTSPSSFPHPVTRS